MRLFIVPCPWAGTGTACAEGAEEHVRDPARRLDVAGDHGGGRGAALTSDPSGAVTVTGANAPPEAGTSGSVRQRTTKYAAERVTASGQLRLPGCCGAVPAKSIATFSPAIVTAARTTSSPSGASSDVGSLVAPVRELGDRRADSPLRVGVELVHRRRDLLAPPPLAELRQAPLGEPVRGELRAQVAPPLLRVPHVGEQDGDAPRPSAGRAGRRGLPGRGRSSRRAGSPARPRPRPRSARGRRRSRRSVRETSVTSGRCVPPVKGSLTTKTSPELGPALAHRRDGLRHRAEVDGDVLGLRDHSAVGGEERGRAVAPLLDVGGEGGADEHGAHLLRDRAERAAENLELNRHDRVRIRVLFPSLAPSHPGGSQQVAPSSSTTGGPADGQRLAAGRSSSGPGVDVGGAHGDELDRRARGRRSRSAPRARGGTTRPGRPRAARSARTTAPRSGGRPRRRRGSAPASSKGITYERTRSRRSSLATRPSAESTPAAAGTSTLPMPSSSASSHACSGPGAAEGDEREVARVVAALDGDEPERAQHLGVDDVDDRLRRRGPRARSSAAARSSSSPPASASGRRPSTRLASVTVGSSPPRP